MTGAADPWNPNANSFVRVVAVQADGRILVGGDFTGASSIGGATRNNIARLDPNTGAADSFDASVNNLTVFAIAQQSDGKILASGIFTDVGGHTRNRIARLETDGRVEQTLDLGNLGGSFPTVHAIAVQLDGKILIGGTFINNIFRLYADGGLDSTFNANANGPVYSIVVQTDGKILVGGLFTGIGGQLRNNIARLDPVTGLADSWNPNANDAVNSIAVQADGKVLAGGLFNGANSIGGQSRFRIARLDPTTGMADSFNPIATAVVNSIAVQADGSILAGGLFNGFNSIGGQARNGIARLDPVTGFADSFNPNANSAVFSIVVQADGKILVGGNFDGTNSIGGQTRNRIARLDPTTGLADSFDPNANSNVYTIVVQGDGKIVAGGDFFGANSIGGQARNAIARLDAETGLADSFDPGADNSVFAIAVQADGKILAGGNFTSIGGQTRSSLARLTNDTIAVQNLTVTQTGVTWIRGGSSPQFTRVTFELSTNNLSYANMGNGTASGSNWTLTTNTLTGQNIWIRARGYYTCGSNNGSESIVESVRNAFLAPGVTISGTITYGNAVGNPPPPRFVRNVTVQSTSGTPMVGPVITGTPGTYTLTGFGATAYTIRPSKPGGANTAITSADAARVAQGVSGTVPFVSQNQRFAADTSGNGGPNPVSSQDAAFIARFAAGLSGFGRTGTWFFFVTGAPSPMPTAPATYNDSRTYASVTGNLTGEDYVAILVGEVSGNYNPANNQRPAVGPEQNVSVELPQITAETGKEIIVPVRVEGAVGKNITSDEFDLHYDPNVIQPAADPVDVAKTASRGLSFVVNPHEPGHLRVVMYGAFPIDSEGVLLNLRFTSIGKPGAVSLLSFERIMFNEGEPRATISDGQVEIATADVKVALEESR